MGTELIETIKKAQNKEIDAFEILYINSQNYIRYCALKYGIPYGDCDDIVQEVYLELYHSIDKLKNPICYQKWLYRVIQSKCYQYVKTKKRSCEYEEYNDDYPHASHTVNQTEEHMDNLSREQSIQDIMSSLNQDMQEIIKLKYLKEMTELEISNEYHIPLGTVKSRLYYAKHKMRNYVVANEL